MQAQKHGGPPAQCATLHVHCSALACATLPFTKWLNSMACYGALLAWALFQHDVPVMQLVVSTVSQKGHIWWFRTSRVTQAGHMRMLNVVCRDSHGINCRVSCQGGNTEEMQHCARHQRLRAHTASLMGGSQTQQGALPVRACCSSFQGLGLPCWLCLLLCLASWRCIWHVHGQLCLSVCSGI